MARRKSVAVVVDASTARASGGVDSTKKEATQCHEALKAIIDGTLRIAMSPLLMAEWERHQSNFARKWLTSMYARRRVTQVSSDPDPKLRSAIATLKPPARRQAALKDAHLIETALKTDNRIVSCDEKARLTFGELTGRYRRLTAIHWVAPSHPQCASWLKSHAEAQSSLLLGS